MKTTATSRRFRPETTSPTRILGGRIGAPTIEALESRIVYSITFTGVPAWLQQGSGPIQHAQVTVPPDNFATGAVESIAVNPFNSSEIYVGTVNGGIWKTSNADPTNSDATDWIPLTDQQATLATGGIAFSTLDPTGKTVYAGTGSFSSLSSSGGPAAGLLHTTDGGATWSLGLLNPGGGEARIRTVVPTGLDLDAGPGVQEMILAGTVLGGGLYRSNDNGTTFTLLSGANGLPAGDISHVIVDPNNSQRYYAAVPNQGIYRGDYSAGTGLITWTQTTGLTGAGTAGNIQLAAHDAGASTVLFALVSGTSRGAFRSTDGAAWNPLATPPALFARDVTQRAANIMVADPTDSTVAYITTYGGGDDIFRYDASGAGSWVVIDHGGALGGTAPHADGRGLVFQTSNTLIQSDDGGIYVIQNPLNAAANAWHSYSGSGSTGLGNTEIHSVAWDSRFNVAVGGFQDNGTNVQNGTGSNVWEHFNGGDGGDVVIDATTLAGTAKTIRYISSQNLGGFSRVVFDSATNITATVGLIPAGGLAGFVGQFVNPVEINALPGLAGESVRIVIGGGTDGGNPVGAMYEANNAGVAANAAAVNWVQVPTGAGFGSVSAMAYGGTRLGVNNPDALYVGSGAGVFVRTAAAGTLNPTTSAFPGSDVTDITLDPLDWQHAFVSSSTGVWETTDAGANWTARTGDLGNSNITSIEYVEHGAVDAVLVGGLGGVYRMLTDDPGDWSEFGIGMPNAVTFDLEYNVTDDVLLAGTLGRGAWTVPSASSSLFNPGVMHLTGDADFAGENDVFRFVRDAANPQTLNIFINNNTPVPNLQVPLFALEQINVDGLGGNDTLIYDSTNGLISVASGTRYDGGTGRDALNLRQTGGVQTGDVYGIGPNNGDGSSVITGATGTQNVQFQNIEPVLDLVPSPTLVVNGSPAANAINYSAGGVVANGLVTIDNFESIEFSNKVALTINGLAGSDEISLHNGTVPTGLIGITVDGGDPTGSDRLLISGTTGADAFTFAPTSLSAGMVTGVVLPVTYLGTEHVVLAGDEGNDTFNLNGANGAVSLLGNAGADRVNFSTAAEAVVFDLDAVGVDQRVTSTDALVTLLDRLENFTGSAFNDILRLDAATFARDINGGPHTVVPPGDKLFFDGQAAVVTVTRTTPTPARSRPRVTRM